MYVLDRWTDMRLFLCICMPVYTNTIYQLNDEIGYIHFTYVSPYIVDAVNSKKHDNVYEPCAILLQYGSNLSSIIKLNIANFSFLTLYGSNFRFRK